MAVVSGVDEPQTEELREFYARLEKGSGGLGVLNILKVMAHSPKLMRAWVRMGTIALTGLELSPRLRELAILRVFQNTGGQYGFAHHVRYGRQAGLRDEEIAALKRYENDAGFSELDRLAVRYADAVTHLRDDAAHLAAELRDRLSERELVELTFCIAHWNMVARILQPLQVEVDPSLVAELPAGWRDWM